MSRPGRVRRIAVARRGTLARRLPPLSTQAEPINAPLLKPQGHLDNLVMRASTDQHWHRATVRVVAEGKGFQHHFNGMASLRQREQLEHLKIDSITVQIHERRGSEDMITITARRRVGHSEIAVMGRDSTWVEGVLSLLTRTAERPLTLAERMAAKWQRIEVTAMSHPVIAVATAAASLASLGGLIWAVAKLLS